MSKTSTALLAPIEGGAVLVAAYHWRHDPSCASAQMDLENAVDVWESARRCRHNPSPATSGRSILRCASPGMTHNSDTMRLAALGIKLTDVSRRLGVTYRAVAKASALGSRNFRAIVDALEIMDADQRAEWLEKSGVDK